MFKFIVYFLLLHLEWRISCVSCIGISLPNHWLIISKELWEESFFCNLWFPSKTLPGLMQSPHIGIAFCSFRYWSHLPAASPLEGGPWRPPTPLPNHQPQVTGAPALSITPNPERFMSLFSLSFPAPRAPNSPDQRFSNFFISWYTSTNYKIL